MFLNNKPITVLVKAICFYFFTFSTQAATAQEKIVLRSAPLEETEIDGKIYTDDFSVMLEGANPFINVIELSNQFSRGGAERKPWSDSHWPTYRGLIATRYEDPYRPDTEVWRDHYNFYQNNPAEIYLASQQTDLLSPAEKYFCLLYWFLGSTQYWTATSSASDA